MPAPLPPRGRLQPGFRFQPGVFGAGRGGDGASARTRAENAKALARTRPALANTRALDDTGPMGNVLLDQDRRLPSEPASGAAPPLPASTRLAALGVTLAGLVALVALVARRWQMIGPEPPGLDGGQWLALGRGLLGGGGRSTDGAYAPLVPALVAIAEPLVGPLPALRLVAILAFAAVVAALYLVARLGLRPWTALGVALLGAGSSAVGEPIAYGGYPQTLAFAALLVGVGALARGIDARRPWRWLLLAAAGLAVAAAAHHVYGLLALLVAVGVWLSWSVGQLGRSRDRRALALAEARPLRPLSRAGGAALLAMLPAATIVALVWLAFVRAGYEPPLAATGLSRWAAFAYAIREAPLLWGAVVAGGALALAATRDRRTPLWHLAAALLVVAGGLFLVVPEARLLPPVLCGAALAVGVGLDRLATPAQGPGSLLPPLVLGALLLGALPAADRQIADYVAYYRVVDPSLVAAARVVAREAGTGSVVVRANRRGWPEGWWFEGLTTARILVDSDPRWLGFRAERRQAALAARFFLPGVSGAAVRRLAAETGVDLLVLRKKEWIGWQRWLAEPLPPVTALFDDGTFLVLRVRPLEDGATTAGRRGRRRRRSGSRRHRCRSRSAPAPVPRPRAAPARNAP